MRNLTPAVKHILIINVLVMIMMYLNETLMVEKFALFFPTSPFFHFWQPVTNMFLHGDFFHLFFNMYSLVIFGSVLERVWGMKKFLIFFFITGLGAAVVHLGVQWVQIQCLLSDSAVISNRVIQIMCTPTVGASGAVYGILMGYGMLYPDSQLSLLFPPVTLKAKWFVLIFAGIELLLGVFATQDGIAHFAHLGGLIFGFILLMIWKKKHTLYSRFD